MSHPWTASISVRPTELAEPPGCRRLDHPAATSSAPTIPRLPNTGKAIVIPAWAVRAWAATGDQHPDATNPAGTTVRPQQQPAPELQHREGSLGHEQPGTWLRRQRRRIVHHQHPHRYGRQTTITVSWTNVRTGCEQQTVAVAGYDTAYDHFEAAEIQALIAASNPTPLGHGGELTWTVPDGTTRTATCSSTSSPARAPGHRQRPPVQQAVLRAARRQRPRHRRIRPRHRLHPLPPATTAPAPTTTQPAPPAPPIKETFSDPLLPEMTTTTLPSADPTTSTTQPVDEGSPDPTLRGPAIPPSTPPSASPPTASRATCRPCPALVRHDRPRRRRALRRPARRRHPARRRTEAGPLVRGRATIDLDATWFRQFAVCTEDQQPPFFPDDANAAWCYARARQICSSCPVRMECLSSPSNTASSTACGAVAPGGDPAHARTRKRAAAQLPAIELRPNLNARRRPSMEQLIVDLAERNGMPTFLSAASPTPR